MAAGNVLLLLFLISVSWRIGSGQIYGIPRNCLINRLDVIRCSFRNPTSTRSPGPNEYGIYSTRFGQGNAGFPTCNIRRRGHRIRQIEQIGINGKVMIFYSPGITLDPPENYGNQMYIDYNFVCDEGEVAYLSITRMDLQGKTCFDQTFNQMRCIDYLQVNLGLFGNFELCGNITVIDDAESLVEKSVQVIFRTSDSARQAGFTASVICFDPTTRDQPDCTRPQGDESPTDVSPTTTTGDPMGRKKRDLESFHERWQRRLAYVKRMKRQSGGGGGINFRYREISVLNGMNVTYSDNRLDFIDVSEERILTDMSLWDILALHTFDASGSVDDFSGDAKGGEQGDQLLLLPGPGPMFVVGQHAFLQLFVVDPRGLVPNPVEMEVLANLTEAQLTVAREQESDRLNISILEPPTFDAGLLFGRRKRQVEERPSFEDEAVLMALENENACNPILRTSANGVIEEVDKTDPDRLKTLRASLLATESPPI